MYDGTIKHICTYFAVSIVTPSVSYIYFPVSFWQAVPTLTIVCIYVQSDGWYIYVLFYTLIANITFSSRAGIKRSSDIIQYIVTLLIVIGHN